MSETRRPKGLFILYSGLTIVTIAVSIYLVQNIFLAIFGGTDRDAFGAVTAPAIIIMLPTVIAGLRGMWQIHFSTTELDESRFRGMSVVRTVVRQFIFVFLTILSYMIGVLTIFSEHVLIGALFIVLSVVLSLLMVKGLEFTLYKMRGMV